MIKGKGWIMRAKREVAMETFDFDETALKPREMAVEAVFTAVSPGTECSNYLALDPDVLLPGKWCTYPWPPGYSGVSRVLAKGTAVTEFNIGDQAVGLLSHRSHQKINADDVEVPLHPKVKPEHAAYGHILTIATSALQVIHVDTLGIAGVWGLGTIGNLTAQFLRSGGYRVVGIDPVKARRTLATRCGIDETLDPTAADFADRINQITRGEGFDVAADTTGRAATTVGIPEFIRIRGQMVLMTHWRSQPVIDTTPFIARIFQKGISLHGALQTMPGGEPWSKWYVLQRRKLTRIQDQIAAGRLQIAPLISHVVAPFQCKEVYEGLSFDQANWWGVVVDWSRK